MTLRFLSFGWPLAVVALWWLMRARRRPKVMAPLLFGALVVTGGLMIASAHARAAIVVLPTALALGLVLAAMVDFTHPPGDEPRPDDDDSGGWGRWTPRPIPPPAGPDRTPEWWDDFEREFWRYVGERTPT